eukprot:3289168-Amphidinium_carterae.1
MVPISFSKTTSCCATVLCVLVGGTLRKLRRSARSAMIHALAVAATAAPAIAVAAPITKLKVKHLRQHGWRHATKTGAGRRKRRRESLLLHTCSIAASMRII